MKRSLLGIGSALLLSVLLVGCGGETKGNTDDQAKENNSSVTASADVLYTENCAGCHGEEMNRMNIDLKTIKDRLGKDEILDIIKNGKNAMPGGLVNAAEGEVVADWLLGQ